jgi:hypothetical protein
MHLRVRARIAQLRRLGLHFGWRRLYFDLYCRIAIAARVLEMRCGDALAPGRGRVLGRLQDNFRCMVWLALRSTRQWFGAKETLGRERAMLVGLLWRRVFVAYKRLRDLVQRRRAPRRAPSRRSPVTSARRALTPLLVDYFHPRRQHLDDAVARQLATDRGRERSSV